MNGPFQLRPCCESRGEGLDRCVGPHLGTGGVDADGVVQLVFGNAALHGGTEALSHLAGVGAEVMEAHHTFLKKTITH